MPPSRTPSPQSSDYLSAKEACALLGVKVASLYSYVSRGVIRSVMQPGTRARLYYREDVESAGKRMGGRAGIPDTVESAVRWGQPMLTSSITQLTEEGPLYRGRPAISLGRSGRSFESAAELLWTGLDLPALRCWEPVDPGVDILKRVTGAAKDGHELTSGRIMALVNVMVALSMPNKPDFERGSTVTDARQLIMLYAAAMGMLGPGRSVVLPLDGEPVAKLLARALLGMKTPVGDATARALDALLIVCADHELSPSTLAARVAASSGAELRACLHAAVATHSGARLGGGCDHTEDLLSRARTPKELQTAIGRMERSGRKVPGFNLVVYPKGDPRARFLLELAAEHADAQNTAFKRLDASLRAAEHAFDLKPSIEVGLVGLAVALRLPPRSASALWAIGRCAGWVAHVIEQRLAGFMLRPRAKYVDLT